MFRTKSVLLKASRPVSVVPIRKSDGSCCPRSTMDRSHRRVHCFSAITTSSGLMPGVRLSAKLLNAAVAICDATSPPFMPPMPSATMAVKGIWGVRSKAKAMLLSRMYSPNTRAMSSLFVRTSPMLLTASYLIFIIVVFL